jgi:hypothetical protein
MKCPDTCKETAKIEKLALEKLANSFRAGYSIREEYIKSVRDKNSIAVAAVPSIESRISSLTSDIERLTSVKLIETQHEKEEILRLTSEISGKVFSVLGIEDVEELTIDTALVFLRGLLDVLAVTAEEVTEISDWEGNQQLPTSSAGSDNSDTRGGIDEDEDGVPIIADSDDPSYDDDGYRDPEIVSPPEAEHVRHHTLQHFTTKTRQAFS